MKANKLVFALDIGTHGVVGLVGERTPQGGLKIKYAEIEEYRQRAMLDGQIHDIPVVAQAVERVKAKLQKKIKKTLTEVAVAAAGRALKTVCTRAGKDISFLTAVREEDVLSLQIQAVQEARSLLAGEENRALNFYCVGYSVMQYFLDGNTIGNLIGQRGSRIEAESIATFLPRVVVDSLYAVLELVDLKVASLTLEPVAAISAIIPPDMRYLNLALVDVGAGTSDIAVTANGTVIGYAMVPIAGDEITEQLCQQYLMDFPTGEKIKRQLHQAGEISFIDVVGIAHRLPGATLIDSLKDTGDNLAGQIAEKILDINGKAPMAVICVGGGSLTPELTERLAVHLGLGRERVQIRGREALPLVTGVPKILSGPESVTPIGIALTAGSSLSLAFTTVEVNDCSVRLLRGERVTVADALLAAGVNLRQFCGRPGLALPVKVNGQLMFIKGELGKPAEIVLNGQPVGLDTELQEHDRLTVLPGKPGKTARARVKDVIPGLTTKQIMVDGHPVDLVPEVRVNGEVATAETELSENDQVAYRGLETVAEVLTYLNRQLGPGQIVYVNGTETTPESAVRHKDVVSVGAKPPAVTVWPLKLNGAELSVSVEQGQDLIFADLFKYIDFPGVPPTGKKNLVMEINGQKATYTTQVKKHDFIRLEWE